MLTRSEVTFTGRVQGVGFRYACLVVSSRFEVMGWVTNLDDGTVRLVVEGDSAEIASFIDAINDQMTAYIRKFDVKRRKATGEFSKFEIRR